MKRPERDPTRKTFSLRSRLLSAPLAPLAAVAVVVGAPADGEAQTAEEILGQALERHQERLQGVEDVTVHQEMMGFRTVTHLVKEEVDGRPVLRVQSVDGAQQAAQGSAGFTEAWADPGVFYDEWAHRWTFQGEGVVDGESTWRLELADLDGLDWEEAGLEEGDAPFEPERMVMELHQEDLVPLRVDIHGEVVEAGATQPMEATIHFSDYREVEGYLHPHRMVMESDASVLGLTDDEMTQALQQLRELPPQQRQAMEEMLGENMDFLMDLLDGDGLRMEVVVTDLRVNSGASSPR